MAQQLVIYALAAVFFLSSAFGQALPGNEPAPAKSSPDYSKQAVVIEDLRTAARFESDGTGWQEISARLRVQSEAGVQALGLLTFGYNTAYERLNVAYVRVIKPDGTQISASSDAIQDLPSEVQRIAPEYTDFREKHINVPALRPGDVLEYSIKTEAFAPMLPGHFAPSYAFNRVNIVLREEIRLDLPADRKIKVKFAPESAPIIHEEPGRKIYAWRHSNSALPDPLEMEAEEAKPADIRVSTFENWSEVANWYAALQRPKLTVSDAIRAKAAELTGGLKTDDEKIAAIYNYVSTNIRYVSISFGMGRFQPHDAAEVLRNQYGDCKDKHTLLAALLAAVGIQVEPVLISAGPKIDPEIPSPFQFNHVMTAVTRGGSYVYADTTTEVAPLGYLIKPLRNKQALRVANSGGGQLIKTPANLPGDNFERINVDARIDVSGRLDADITTRAAGDAEVLWRSILRRTAEVQWPLVLKAVAASSGIDGEVSDASVANLSDTNKPFELKYHLAKKDYVSWKERTRRLDLPFIKLNLRPAATPREKKGPIEQEENFALERTLRLQVPPGVTVLLPESAHEKEDFAEYEATYRNENNILTAARTYRMKMAEIPRSRYKDFNRLHDTASSDEEQAATFEVSEKFLASTSKAEGVGPERTASTEELLSQGNAALAAGKFQEAERLLEKVTVRDPQDADAWVLLGRLYSRRGLEGTYGDKAIDAFHQALASNPHHQSAWAQLGTLLEMKGQYIEAAEAFRKQLEITPEGKGLKTMLGDALIHANRPAEAIPVLEQASAQGREHDLAKLQLARAYVLTGEQDKAMLTLEAIVKERPGVMARVAAADLVAVEGVFLDWAEQQIQQALSSAYKALKSTNLEFAGEPDIQRGWKLAHIWATAGWVYFQQGDLERAQKYLEAAWVWVQDPNIGDRLAQLYSKQGRTDDAVRTWAEALSTDKSGFPEVRLRFVKAVGDRQRAEQLIQTHRLNTQQARTIEVSNAAKISGTAEMYVLIGPDSKIERISVTDGDLKLQKFESDLKQASVPMRFPDTSDVHVVRSAAFSCLSTLPKCELVLKPIPAFMVPRGYEF